MGLTDKIKDIAIGDLKQVNMIAFDIYSRANSSIFNLLCENGLAYATIENALEIAVLKQAKSDFEYLTKPNESPRYADHIGREDCFAYALEKNYFSEKEITNIPFDGQNVKEYIQTYGKKDLLVKLRMDLLNPKPLPHIEISDDEQSFL